MRAIICLVLWSSACHHHSDESCAVGQMLINHLCYCEKGTTWNGLACQGTPDPSGCSGNAYWFGPDATLGGGCYCLAGYTLNAKRECEELHCTGGAVPGVSQCVCPNHLQWNGAECVVPTCNGGSVWTGAECACQGGSTWNGSQCMCNGGSTWNGSQCTCTGGASWDGSQCMCPAGNVWNGSQCVVATCSGGAVWDGTQCMCQGGSTWDGAQCVCAAGQTWDGAQCVDARQGRGHRDHDHTPGGQCRSLLIAKGYGPDQLGNCEGVNDRCAVALIQRGYGPDQLGNCRGRLDGACAEQLIAKGYGPDQIGNCRR